MSEQWNKYDKTAARIHGKPGREVRPQSVTDRHSRPCLRAGGVAVRRAASRLATIPLAHFATPETKALNSSRTPIRRPAGAHAAPRRSRRHGIDMQMIAPPPPQCYYSVPLDIAVKAAQIVNDGIAAFCAE